MMPCSRTMPLRSLSPENNGWLQMPLHLVSSPRTGCFAIYCGFVEIGHLLMGKAKATAGVKNLL